MSDPHKPPSRRQKEPPGGGGWAGKIADALVDLLKVKSLVTLVLIGVLSWTVLRGVPLDSDFKAIVMSVITYFFARSSGREK